MTPNNNVNSLSPIGAPTNQYGAVDLYAMFQQPRPISNQAYGASPTASMLGTPAPAMMSIGRPVYGDSTAAAASRNSTGPQTYGDVGNARRFSEHH
jgi:hypothetical protein